MFGISESEVVSFIDLGTNSVHLLVVSVYPGMLGVPLFQDKETIRLGQTLYQEGRLSDEVIERCRITVDNFVKHSRDLGAQKIFCFATSAAREAVNRGQLIESLEDDGVDIRVIPGPEEARLIRLGLFGPSGPSERTLTIDIGGGSTELTLSQGDDIQLLDSLRMGAVRMSYGYGVDVSGPISERQTDNLMRLIEAESYRDVRIIGELGFDRVVGSSGTLMALADMAAAKRKDHDSSYLLRTELDSMMSELSKMSVEERTSYPKLSASRADIIIGGGYIALALMRLLSIKRMEISDKGLREGMLVDYMMAVCGEGPGVRESSVRNLAERFSYNREHADQVRRLSVMLAQQMIDQGLLIDDSFPREFLPYAATLHDIGEFISYTRHNIHTYTIIMNSYMLGFDYRELEYIALIARFHHKKFPKKNDKYLADLTPDIVSRIRKCALILKTADVLDRHRRSLVHSVVLDRSMTDMDITIVAEGDTSMEVWRLEELKPEYADVFGVNIRINTDACVPDSKDL